MNLKPGKLNSAIGIIAFIITWIIVGNFNQICTKLYPSTCGPEIYSTTIIALIAGIIAYLIGSIFEKEKWKM